MVEAEAVAAQRSVTDDLEILLEVMPPKIRKVLDRAPDREDLLEVVLDLGRLPEARFPGRALALDDEPVSREELATVVERVGRFGADNRAGIERTLHRISALRNREGDVIGLTCRVGRAVFGTVDILRDVIEAGESILLLGRPGVGKTTLLREAARVLADELEKRVVVVDTSNEIAGDGDIPHPGIGRARRMQVPSPERQHAVMIEAVENHMPEVIVIDEIGTGAEALAARTIAERGVQLIATAHGNSLDNLLQNPTLADLVGGIHAVTLSDEEARRRRTQKTVLERKAPPTFDVVVEIQARDRLAVHHRVAETVDRYLRGEPLRPERRTRTDGGEVQIEEPAATVPPPARPFRPPEDLRGGLRDGARDELRPPPRPAPEPAGGAGLQPERRVLRVFPYAVSRGKLERAIRDLGVSAFLVDDYRQADLVLTLKSQERRQPKRLREAEARGLPLEVVRSNTVKQMEKFLRGYFGIEELPEGYELALEQAEKAIDQVLDRGHPVELSPQDRQIRRLQHELVDDAGLTSESKGNEPYRRVVIYPR
ncbi:MAG TPA: R3H domain-containing nucleic acid-binding protein [Thermoanaerobaculia bacterium]|nr:R3H domain-containing nucleic acid-binding protein [Thermoanaerobaculia bacterium]